MTFPFVVEPRWSSPVQAAWWSAAFLGFAGLCALCALRTWNVSFAPAKAKAGDEAAAERYDPAGQQAASDDDAPRQDDDTARDDES